MTFPVSMTACSPSAATIPTSPFSHHAAAAATASAHHRRDPTTVLDLRLRGGGANPLAAFFRIPAPLRYFISGNLGNALFYCTELLCTAVLKAYLGHPEHMPSWADSATFFTAYLLHVPGQHYSHALLVYGLDTINTRSKYIQTLSGTYSALMLSAVGSTFLNQFLLNLGFSKPVAFLGTLYLFAFVNYLFIGWIVRQSNKSSVKSTSRRTPSKSTERTRKLKVRGGGHFTSSFHQRSVVHVPARIGPLVSHGDEGVLQSLKWDTN